MTKLLEERIDSSRKINDWLQRHHRRTHQSKSFRPQNTEPKAVYVKKLTLNLHNLDAHRALFRYKPKGSLKNTMTVRAYRLLVRNRFLRSSIVGRRGSRLLGMF